MNTTISNNHSHNWSRNSKFTSFNLGHKHRIDINIGLALPNKPSSHSHRLIFKEKRRIDIE